MHRLFVAIRPPEPVRNQLLDLMEGVADVRWQEDEHLHLTLRFIGEVDRHLAEDVHAALGSIHQRRFSLQLAGLGSFDRRGGTGVLWAGVGPQEPLHALHKKIDQALDRIGVEPDRRAYSPHISIARLGRGAGSIEPLVRRWGGITSELFEVREFRLYESRLTPQGALHSVVERYPLG